jgi:hypothetical protein
MSGRENLIKRIQVRGGNQEGRMIADKLKSLKKALLYSYQAATITLADGRKFRALINPDRLKADYDHKILSIPFEDICLNEEERVGTTTEGLQEIGIKSGDVFYWDDKKSYWLVYMQHYEEDAYFRGEIRLCEETVTINEVTYHIYIRGPVETTIPWNQRKDKNWNDMNYTSECFITKDENTLNYIHRFAKLMINDKKWEVQTTDPYSGEGIIQFTLKEWFNNSIEEAVKEEEDTPPEEPVTPPTTYIEVPAAIYPYDTFTCTLVGVDSPNGIWELVDSGTKATITAATETTVTIKILTGKSTSFSLRYRRQGEDDITSTIEVLSF